MGSVKVWLKDDAVEAYFDAAVCRHGTHGVWLWTKVSEHDRFVGDPDEQPVFIPYSSIAYIEPRS